MLKQIKLSYDELLVLHEALDKCGSASSAMALKALFKPMMLCEVSLTGPAHKIRALEKTRTPQVYIQRVQEKFKNSKQLPADVMAKLKSIEVSSNFANS
jgi:hypothetical protein